MTALPRWIRPQLTRLVDVAPEGEGWLHEIKYDGYRMHARLDHGVVTLLTRTGLDWTPKYPAMADAVASLGARHAYLDGELCGVGPDGITSFSMIQLASDAGNAAGLLFFLFDLLHLDGDDLAARPLIERKARLTELVTPAGAPLQYSDHQTGHGPAFFAKACAMKLEGIVSKRADAPYAPGNRGLWLKVKCLHREEFVVIGWTDPEGSRPFLGALLLGYYDPDGRLVYTGRVGTGINTAELEQLWRRLQPLATPTMPLDVAPPRSTRFGSPLVLSRVHWVRPELVAEVNFSPGPTTICCARSFMRGCARTSRRGKCGATSRIRLPASATRAPGGGNRAAVNRQSGPAARHSVGECGHGVRCADRDTWERIGTFAGLKGPLPAGVHGCIFGGWRHPDGSLRLKPPALPGSTVRPSQVKLCIPVSDPASADLELMVPPTYLDFISHHPAFHPFPPRPWRGNGSRMASANNALSHLRGIAMSADKTSGDKKVSDARAAIVAGLALVIGAFYVFFGVDWYNNGHLVLCYCELSVDPHSWCYRPDDTGSGSASIAPLPPNPALRSSIQSINRCYKGETESQEYESSFSYRFALWWNSMFLTDDQRRVALAAVVSIIYVAYLGFAASVLKDWFLQSK